MALGGDDPQARERDGQLGMPAGNFPVMERGQEDGIQWQGRPVSMLLPEQPFRGQQRPALIAEAAGENRPFVAVQPGSGEKPIPAFLRETVKRLGAEPFAGSLVKETRQPANVMGCRHVRG